MQSIEKLLEKQKAIEVKRKKINAMIRQAQENEQKGKFVKAGEELFEYFKKEPKCTGSEKIAAICNKYFFVNNPTDIEDDSASNTKDEVSDIGKDSKKTPITK